MCLLKMAYIEKASNVRYRPYIAAAGAGLGAYGLYKTYQAYNKYRQAQELSKYLDRPIQMFSL